MELLIKSIPQNIPESPDLLSWLIDAEKESPDSTRKGPSWLIGDAGIAIVAGSDTTTITLTHIFYYLIHLPKVFSRLGEELDGFYQPGCEPEFKELQEAAYLNGVINEALRLHPPIPSGLLRQTLPEGINVG